MIFQAILFRFQPLVFKGAVLSDAFFFRGWSKGGQTWWITYSKIGQTAVRISNRKVVKVWRWFSHILNYGWEPAVCLILVDTCPISKGQFYVQLTIHCPLGWTKAPLAVCLHLSLVVLRFWKPARSLMLQESSLDLPSNHSQSAVPFSPKGLVGPKCDCCHRPHDRLCLGAVVLRWGQNVHWFFSQGAS